MTRSLTDSVVPALQAPRRKVSFGQRFRRDKSLLLLAVPGLALVLVFHYVPLLGNVIAFQQYLPYLPFSDQVWVGWRNFEVIVNGNPQFLNALRNTLVMTIIQVVLIFPVPIGLALVLNSMLSERLKRLVQSILYMPHFLSWVIVVAIFQQVLGGAGLLNTTLRNNGLQTLDIIGNPDVFLGLLTSQVLWKDTGWATILFLAALSQIDQSLYEAASVDGASPARQTWHVTLPGIRGIIVLLLILRLGDSLSVGFEQFLLQQPAVGLGAAEVLDTYVYNNGIVNGQWGVASAVGLVKGLVSVALVLAANRVAHLFGEAGLYQREQR